MNFLKKSQSTSANSVNKSESLTPKEASHTSSSIAQCVTLIDSIEALFKTPPHKYKGDEPEIREYTLSFLELKTLLTNSNSKFEDLTVRRLHDSIFKLKDAIHRLVASDRFERTISHLRLRRKLDGMLGEIQLIKLSLLTQIPQNSEIQAQAKFMISSALVVDVASQWISSFGFMTWISWNRFIDKLKSWIGSEIDDDEQKVLKLFIDHSACNLVSVWRFGDFLTAFGPIKSKSGNCLLHLKVVVHEKWFGGMLSRLDAEGLLHNCVEGTFLVRFSKTIGQFAYSLVGQDRIFHVPITAQNGQFSVTESNTKTVRNFPSLHDMIQFYRGTLLKPLPSNLHLVEWFHGDLTPEEAAEYVLSTKEFGTFLLRFSASHPGSLAVSFLDEKLNPRQILLSRLKDGKWQPSAKDFTYVSLQEFVDESISTNLIRKPVVNPVSTISSVLNKWHEEARQQNTILNSIWKPFME